MVSQFLSGKQLNSPKSLVQKMGALQAQHFDMAKWAIGKRMSSVDAPVGGFTENKNTAPPVTVNTIHQAMEKGEIVRTHALRPTWHFLAGEDLLWILQLTGPSIKGALFSRDKVIGIAEKEYIQSDEAIRRILEDQKALTRQDLVEELRQRGFAMDEYRSNHYIMHAELEGIICSGTVQANKHTYALSENILGKGFSKALKLKEQLKGEPAAAELAKRYFSTRGPATVQDFAWWSGLGMTAIKRAIGALGKSLEVLPREGVAYYQILGPDTAAAKKDTENQLQLLAAFDEYLISYKDRNIMLDKKHSAQIITSNGLFRPAMVENGKVIGGWQIENGKKGCKVKLMPFESLNIKEKRRLQIAAENAAESYSRFCQVPLLSVNFV